MYTICRSEVILGCAFKYILLSMKNDFTKKQNIEQLIKLLDEKQAQEKVLRDEIALREEELNNLLASTSWRITGPLRKVSHISRKALKKSKRGRRLVTWTFRDRKESQKNPIRLAHRSVQRKDWQAALSALQLAFEKTWEERYLFSIISRLADISNYKTAIKNYIKGRRGLTDEDGPKIAIYTAITGNYESLKLPEVLDPRFDYIVFTDSPAPDTGVFQVRPITYFNEDSTRAARFVKTHPHWLLKEYDIAIWVDASIMIAGDIYPLVEQFLNSGKPLGAIPHPHRQTVYQELEACLSFGKDNAEEMIHQVDTYRKQGFDGKGLIESGFMIFDIRNTEIGKFLDFWWKEIDTHSRRDQLSVGFSLAKNKLAWHPLTQPPHSIRDHPLFVLTVHGSKAESTMQELLNAVSLGIIDPFEHKPYARVKAQRVTAQKKRKIDVIVCVHNALDEVKLCLDSIAKHRTGSNQKLIVVDDGSDKPTADYLRDFVNKTSWAKLIRHENALRYTKAANAGLKASSAELVILLNSDTVVTDGWAEKMADAVFSTPGAGLVGPLSSAASVQSIPSFESTKNQTAINDLPKDVTIEDMNKYCEKWASALVPYATMLHGFCLGIRREVIRKIGTFDEKSFPRGYGEENDYCFRAVNAGFGLVVATHTYVFHAKSKSYDTTSVQKNLARQDLMAQGSGKLRELYSKRRITNAIRSMQDNPMLVRMRSEARKLY